MQNIDILRLLINFTHKFLNAIVNPDTHHHCYFKS